MTLAVIRPGKHPVIRPGENTAEAARQATRAEAAADAAAASEAVALAAAGPNYADTAAGLAATSEGETFAVEDDGIVTIYRHDSGPTATELRVLPTAAALASTDPGKGDDMVVHDDGETVREHINRSFQYLAGTDTAAIQAAIAAGIAAKRPTLLDGKTYSTAEAIDARDIQNDRVAFLGTGRNRTNIVSTNKSAPVLRLSGRYQEISGFTVGYDTPADRTETSAVAVTAEDYFHMGKVSDLLIRNAYVGWEDRDGDGVQPQSQFQNTFSELRFENNYRHAIFGNSSGSIYLNIYMSSVLRPSTFRAMDVGGSAEFIRLNIEHQTIRDKVIHAASNNATTVSISRQNWEGLSLIGRGSSLGETFTPCGIYFSGHGPHTVSFDFVDSCHFGGYIVKSLTRSGTTATATLETMGFQQKEHAQGGLGFHVGDVIYIDGCADYNGTATLTEVDNAARTISWTCSGSEATPAVPDAGHDCIVTNLGNQRFSDFSFVYAVSGAQDIVVPALRARDMRCIAASPAKRATLVRLAGFGSDCPARVRFPRIGFGGEMGKHTHWNAPLDIVGFKRVNDVATIYFRRKHRLASDAILNIAGCADSSFNVTTSGPLSPAGPYAVSFANEGSDVLLTRETSADAVLQTYAISNVALSDNIATITTSAAHGLSVGHQVALRCSNAAFSAANKLVLSVPTSTTFTVRIEDDDIPATAATGSVQLIEFPLSTGNLAATSTMNGLVGTVDWFDEYQAVIDFTEVAAGGTATNAQTVQSVTVGRDRVEIVSIEEWDARLNLTAAVTSSSQVTFTAHNPTAGAINPVAAIVTFRIVRA